MRLIRSECISSRRRLTEAKEALSRYVRLNGHRRDAEIHAELNRLVMEHLAALEAWESHRDLHEAAAQVASATVNHGARV